MLFSVKWYRTVSGPTLAVLIVLNLPKRIAVMDESTKDQKPDVLEPAKINYFLMLASVFFGVTALIAVIVAYVYRQECPAWLKSHFDFQIRTFWIGCLYFTLGVLTSFIGIGVLILILTTIWWIVRSVKGFKTLSQQMPPSQVYSWWM
jgi:uncharacterized membrane protein